MHFLRLYLLIAPNLLLIPCLVGVLRDELRRRYPVFGLYISAELAIFLILFLVDRLIAHSMTSLLTYRWILVIGTGVSALLALGVLYELADELILSRSSISRLLRPIVKWTAAILVLTAAFFSALLTSLGTERVITVFQTLDFSANLIKIGLLLALLLLTSVLDVSWRSLPAGIALGFGIWAAAEISASALISQLGSRGYVTIDFIRMGAFHLCVLIWLVYIFLPERTAQYKGTGLSSSELELRSQELRKMVQR